MCGILCVVNFSPVKCMRFRFDELETKEIDKGKIIFSDNRKKIHEELISKELRELENFGLNDLSRIENAEKFKKLVKMTNLIKSKTKKNQKEDQEQLRTIEKEIKFLKIDQSQKKTKSKNENSIITRDKIEKLFLKNSTRGPDYIEYIQFEWKSLNFIFFSAVLSLRKPFEKQPVCFDDFVLQFNGEIYNDESLFGNDTNFFVQKIRKNVKDNKDREISLMKTVYEMKGEFSYLIFDKQANKIYFGLDKIGTKSLLYYFDDHHFVITSVANGDDIFFKECKNQFYIFDLNSYQLNLFSYSEVSEKLSIKERVYCMLPYDSNAENFLIEKIQRFHDIFKNSVKLRLKTLSFDNNSSPCVSILFSGGLDSTILTALISELITEEEKIFNGKKVLIDLISVGFENPRIGSSCYDCPDRHLSQKSWFYLSQKYNSKRLELRLVEVDVSYKDWIRHHNKIISLIYPCTTEIDFSISAPFYFASSNIKKSLLKKFTQSNFPKSLNAFLENPSIFLDLTFNYTSNGNVLFTGLGADELFAGYSKYDSCFKNLLFSSDSSSLISAYSKISSILLNDITVLHKRNLGRDDRIISFWGKEVRYPFLDEDLVLFAINELEPNLKINLSDDLTFSSSSDKKKNFCIIKKYFLRVFAVHLGLNYIKNEPKRAIQFGSRSAKLEIDSGKTKGSDTL